MLVEDFIITVYCLVDDLLNKISNENKLRKRGFEPALSDSEMITMEVIAEFQGIDTDKGAWEYFCNHWRTLFPNIGSRSNFVQHAANLWVIKQYMQKELAKQLGATSDFLHLADGFPMPVCHFKRANFSQVFTGEANYGYCASKGETYYGFKGNLLISSEGIVTAVTVTQANIDERESMWDLIDVIHGAIIAD